MLIKNIKIIISLFTLASLLIFCGFVSATDEITKLEFKSPPVSPSDTERSLQSIVKIQGTGGLCQDAVYLITHYGDHEELFWKENQKAIDDPLINQTWRYCSVFTTSTDKSILVGRNWDNQNVGSIIVSLYKPPDGYASISFSRAIDMGYPLNLDLEDIKSSDLANKLLLAPFYAMDGINEHGLTVAITGVNQVTVKPKEGKESVFITFLVRKILDHTKTTNEAVNLVRRYIPFDLDINTLDGHLCIMDSSGKSVILEYSQDEWKKIYSDKPYQVLTTRPIYNVPDSTLREKCWRYRTISETLDKTDGNIDWRDGLNILHDVSQKGTTWSVIYSPRTLELYFTVYQEWGKIYWVNIDSN